MSIINRGSSIDASYQVSVHLAEGSEEKITMWRVNGRQTTDDDAKSSHCLWQGGLKSAHYTLYNSE
jgi:hypothetical protein